MKRTASYRGGLSHDTRDRRLHSGSSSDKPARAANLFSSPRFDGFMTAFNRNTARPWAPTVSLSHSDSLSHETSVGQRDSRVAERPNSSPYHAAVLRPRASSATWAQSRTASHDRMAAKSRASGAQSTPQAGGAGRAK